MAESFILSNMATSTKPVILVLSIGGDGMQDMCDDIDCFSASLNNLSKHADLKRARAAKAALSYLDKNTFSPPNGILITDPGVTQPDSKELLARVVAYARAGGTVVISYCFTGEMSLKHMAGFWKNAWGLPWETSSWHCTNLVLNESASTLRGPVAALQKVYSLKALSLKNVERDHSWYLPVEESVTQSAVFPPKPDNQDETAVAFAPIGQGFVGFTGDVNMEQGTHMVVMRMFGL